MHEEVTAKTTVTTTPQSSYHCHELLIRLIRPSQSLTQWRNSQNSKNSQIQWASSITSHLPKVVSYMPTRTWATSVTRKICELARQGELPKEYITLTSPACAACMYATATKLSWRSKTKNHKNLVAKQQLQAGNCVAVDMLNYPAPGLISQLTGRLTKLWYNYAMVYVDAASRYIYIVLKTMDSATDTLKWKEAFEHKSTNRGIKIKAYHTDNGTFRSNTWRNHCHLKN